MNKTDAARDLARHLGERIETVLQDYFERCGDINVDMETACTLALTTVSVQMSMLALMLDATDAEFMKMCRWHLNYGRQMMREMQGD